MMANGMDWHNVPASERDPRTRTTRHDVGQIVVVTTHHADGSQTVGVVERSHADDVRWLTEPVGRTERDPFGLDQWRKGE